MIVYLVTTRSPGIELTIEAAFELRENAVRWVDKQDHPSFYDIESWTCKDKEVMDNV